MEENNSPCSGSKQQAMLCINKNKALVLHAADGCNY